jgi:flavin-dependent dehydrogenase
VFQQHGQTEHDPVHGFIAWMKQQVPALNRRLEGAQLVYSRWMAIAQVPFEPKESILRDVLLAGDASGLIAPLAGDGISMALEAGWLAGDLSSRFLSGQWQAVELRREYMKEWRKRFAFRLALGRMLQPLLLEPASAEKIFRLLAASPAFGQTLIRWTRGKLPQQVRTGSLG